MDIHDFTKKTDTELQDMLRGFESDMRSYRFQLASTQLKNVRQVRKTRKDIARIKTILSQRAKVIKPQV